MSNRIWFRNLYLDHPVRADNSHKHGADKTKVYCKQCFEHDLEELRQKDDAAVRSHLRNQERSDEDLRELLWSSKTNVRSSHTKTMANHLKDCIYQPQSIRDAIVSHIGTYSDAPAHLRSPSAQRTMSRQQGNSLLNLPDGSLPGGNYQQSASGSSISPPSLMPTGISHRYAPYSQPLSISTRPSSPVGLTSGRDSPSADSSLHPSDSASQSSYIPPNRRASRSRPHSQLSRRNSEQFYASGSHLGIEGESQPIRPWSAAEKKKYETSLLRLTASAGFPLSWVENPEWHALREAFMPGAPYISRKVLTQRILPSVVAECRNVAKINVKGSEATMQSDGWTGVNNHHLVAFMITANKKVQTVDVHNTTADRHTAENYLKEIEEVYEKLRTDWDVLPVALVTDASGEARKARKLFSLNHEEMIVLDCYSHQINLIVGDFFKSKSALLNWTEPATQLIAWLRSKSRILCNLPLAVLRAVITRWTAHYMAFRRLLQLYPTLTALNYNDRIKPDDLKILVTGDSASKKHARKMVKIIENAAFWQNIALITRYLEPLAIAANVVQASFCRIDQVLLTFGYLVHRYQDSLMDSDITSRDAIINSIEKRWAKSDQQVFICSVILNPFYRNDPFASNPVFSRANIRIMCESLFQRFYGKEAPYEFGLDIYQYLDGTGDTFRQLKSQVDWEIKAADKQKRQPDPLAVYTAIATPGRSDESGFFPFARRLLSVSANSASCERLFSVFGNTLTKLRNKLGDKTLVDLTEVKMHIRDEHICNKESKQRLKRRFEHPIATSAPDNEPQVNPASEIAARQETLDAIVAELLSTPPPQSDPLNAPFERYTNMDTDANDNEAPSDSFADLMRQNIELVHNDVDTAIPTVDIDAAGPTIDVDNWSNINISDLFDFKHPSWATMYGGAVRRSFEEELALYELLDRDAEGDEDLGDAPQPSFDTTTEDILLA